MSEHYIDLTIKDKQNNEVQLSDIIETHQVSIILGNPGSGKTTLFKHYQKTSNKNVELLSVQELIRLPKDLDKKSDVLLLDGVDEYRIVSQDIFFVANELAYFIEKLLKEKSDLKIILACREMDWSREDNDKLEGRIKQKIGIFYIQPLDLNQQEDFAKLIVGENSNKFLMTFQNNDFLETPHLFRMLAKSWKEDQSFCNSKMDIYKAYIKYATREFNKIHKQHRILLGEDQILKLLGYLSYFYFFCGVDKYEEEFLEDICTDEYPYEQLNQIVKTILFSNRTFFHKTIAEFTLAYHIVNFKVEKLEEFKMLFIDQAWSISPRLRGAYAWLCSLSEDIELIKIDPYYQAIYGDNSLFDAKRKIFVLQAIREYSQGNPYFINFSQYLNLKGFYSEELDQTLMSEYNRAIELKNHYVYFLSYIIAQEDTISNNMEEFVKRKIEDRDIPYYYKLELLKYFQKDIEGNKDFLLRVLNLSIEEKINDDENSLKDFLLGLLYPKYVKPQEIADYLIRYKETDALYQHYLYLFDTPFECKKKLVEEILNKKDQINNKKYSFLPYYIYAFIKDFFFDIYLKTTDIREIFTCLMDFQYDYFKYNKIEIEPFGYAKRNEAKKNQERLQDISNQLFEINVQERVYGKDDFWTYNIYHFPYYCSPTNKTQVFQTILKEMTQKEEKKESERYIHKKSGVFFAWLNSLSQEEKKGDGCRKTAEENGLLKEYAEYVLKEEKEEEKNKKWEQEQQEKLEIERKQNDNFFISKKIKEFAEDLGVMSWIADLYLYKREKIGVIISHEIFEKKSKKALNMLLYNKSHPFLKFDLTIKERSKQPQNSIRNIDSVYYASMYSNNKIKLTKLDKNFRSYLYIIALWYENMYGIHHKKVCSYIENKDKSFARDTLKEYITLLIRNYFGKRKVTEVILKYINKEKNIGKLKKFCQLHTNQNDLPNNFVQQFINSFGFLMSLDELKIFDNAHIGKENHATIRALQDFNTDSAYSLESALSIFSLLDVSIGATRRFKDLNNSLKIKILNYLMNVFNTEELLREQRSTSAMSTRDLCLWFLKYEVWKDASETILTKILKKFKKSIWEYKILHTLNTKKTVVDCGMGTYKINKIKEMLSQDLAVNQRMFFEIIYQRFKMLAKEIETNEDSNKDTYYNTNGKKDQWIPKDEEKIRNIIFADLKKQYKKDTIWIREKYEADNRVDIHARYRHDRDFRVQIECKKDTNSKLIKGLKEQLIDKYLRAEDSFGIYLVFYFGEAKYSKEEILNLLNSELKNNENSKYKERIKILIIDFTVT